MRLILLRGLGRDQAHWPPLIDKLAAKFPQAIIETPDLPGAGVLHKVSSPLKIADYPAYIKPQLSQQLKQQSDNNILIGLSLGGMIALKWAEQEPNNFEKIVLINSSSCLSPFFERLKIFNAFKYFSFRTLFNLRAQEKAKYHLTCNQRPMNESLLDRWVEIQRQHPVSVSNQLKQLFAAAQFKPPAASKLPPIHVLYSLKDNLVSYKASESLINFYHATFDQHATAGHDLPQDDPDWISEKLYLLLSGNSTTLV